MNENDFETTRPEAPETPEGSAPVTEPIPETASGPAEKNQPAEAAPETTPDPFPNWNIPLGEEGFANEQTGGGQAIPPQPQPPVSGQPPVPGQPPYYPPQGYGAQPTQQPAPPYYPPYYGYPTQPYAPPAYPPKKKLSTGAKVFIWIASILAGAAIIGFGVFLAMRITDAVGRTPLSDYYDHNSVPSIPTPNIPDEPDLPGDDTPDREPYAPYDGEDIPPSTEEDNLPEIDVTPNTEGITIEPRPAYPELSAAQVYQQVVQSTVTVVIVDPDSGETTGTGTGIIATSDGYIVTNSHVVNDSRDTRVDVITYDGQRYVAVVVGVDRTTDLAILKTEDMDFTPAHFGDSDSLVIGDMVIAIGNPGGERYSASMTGGYISGLGREVSKYSGTGMTYIQTDAAINPGNSGGPLVNMYGQVVGINSVKIVRDDYEGMGFAIPITGAKDFIDQLMAEGYVEGRTRLGIRGMDVTDEMRMAYDVPGGFLITEIEEISAFTGTDAAPGDIITAIDGETVTDRNGISQCLGSHAPGDTVTVTLYRPDTGDSFDVEGLLLEDKGET